MADKDILGNIKRIMASRQQINEGDEHGSSSLLVEFAPANVQREGKKLFVEGVFLSSKPNKNGRVYSDKVLSIATGHIKNKVDSGQMFQTLGHGDSPTVDPNKIAGVVKSLTKKGSDYYGRSEILSHGAGLVTRSIIDAGGKIGVSSRGTGSTKRNKQTGLQEVCEDYRIHSLDLVCEPSTGHLVDAMYESVASETLSSQKLSCDDLATRVIDILSKLGHPEIVAAQKKHAIDFDAGPGKYQNPHSDLTYLQNLESDRAQIIRQLLDIQQKIALQNDQGNLKDKFAAYAKLIQRTSDPIKRTQLRREVHEVYYSNKLLEATVKLLSRGGKYSPPTVSEEIQTIRKRSGSRLPNLQREHEMISEDYDRRDRERQDQLEKARAENIIKNRRRR